MKGAFLIVDGHSVIHAWDDLLALHRGPSRGMARTELVKRLQGYQDATGDPVMVVFDGRGERVSSEREPEGIQIVYSKSGRTADDVIERLVARYAKDYDIRVVTADRAEQETVSAFGGMPIGTEMLRDMLERAERELGARIRKIGRG